ncbi:MAG: ABC transporter permease [FCB group bacterium]|nr:ABC transporter permease [FCB group bacterium]MBL7029390.1 ABC transporter permease [Candidatus Neomarinimicrobiota bacterium]MBL7123108.1 ABC transporter permease [Candidatus Neomarinimicrobiota bacterium]
MIWAIFTKSVKEQLRNFWILILTVSMAPFFVFVYFLINEASQPHYRALILNQDEGFMIQDTMVNLGDELLPIFNEYTKEVENIPLSIRSVSTREVAIKKLENRNASVLLVIPPHFTQSQLSETHTVPEIEIVGDLTNTGYLISAVFLGEMFSDFMVENAGQQHLFKVKETALGQSGQIDEFELWMPGMLILSIIMLMFSATIAIIVEVDQGTILRLKLSGMKAWQFLVGVGSSQVLVGIIAIFLTLGAATSLGFEMRGAFTSFLLITVLTSISMIAFSLILAAATRSVTDVLVVGNFPLFLFMFFSGAAFPISTNAWFYLGDYGVSWQTLMSAAPAISALQKISIMGVGLSEVGGELLALTLMTVIYFMIGLWGFQRRHLRTK